MTELKTLSDAFVQKAHEIIGRYPVKRSALIMLLHEAQDESGFISDQVIEDVAEVMGLTAADVEQVATFYTMFKRRNPGKFLISVCTNLSCMINGAEDTAAALHAELGPPHAATPDGLCSWESVECLATCHWAVAAQVNYLDVPYLTADRARKLVTDLKAGRDLDGILAELRQARSLADVSANGNGASSPEPSGGADER